jgi:predicted ATPase/DNA-binding CsgD family transcriptional regulator
MAETESGGGMAAVSAREVEVLAAVGQHLSNREIAHLLHISERTVESHVSSLLRKFDVVDRRALAGLALRASASSGPQRIFRGLPAAWTTFVGRTAEIERLTDAILRHRLVTVLGPGGIGKTRLTSVVAGRLSSRFRGGGGFIDLVAVRPDRLERAVASGLGVLEQPGVLLTRAVHVVLSAGPSLVVLDNCEHLLDSAIRWVRTSLAACPDLTVVCTSREPLQIPGERLVVIPPMGDDAPSLLLARTDAIGTQLDATPIEMEELCRRLDGNPLAIELAAARLPSLGFEGLWAGLDDQLRVLSAAGSTAPGAADRHRSLRAVLEWSHDLLADEERRMLRRLGVFVGSIDLEAAGAVLPGVDRSSVADLVGRLTDKCLLNRDGLGKASATRWRLLDTVRAFALDLLIESGEAALVEALRLGWAVRAATKLEDRLVSEGVWQEDFEAIADDLRAALAGPSQPDQPEARYRLGLSLGHLAYARALLSEACSHYVTAAETVPDASGAYIAWRRAAAVSLANQRIDAAVGFLEQAAMAADQATDRVAHARALADIARIMGRFPSGFEHQPDPGTALDMVRRAKSLEAHENPGVDAAITLGAAWNARMQPTETDPGLAARALDLARAADDPILISEALDALASAASFGGRHREAAVLAAERLGLLHRMSRHDPDFGLEILDAYHAATETALAAGDPSTAATVAQRCRSDRLSKAVPYHADSRLALALVLLGDFDGAIARGQDARDSWIRSGRPTAGWMANAFYAAALAHGLRGNWPAFEDWWGTAGELSTRSSTNEMPAFVALRLQLHTGRAATTILGGEPEFPPGHLADYSRAIALEAGSARGDPGVTDHIHDDFSQNPYAATFLQRAAGRLERDRAQLSRALQSWEQLGAGFERAVTLTMLPDRSTEGLEIITQLGCTRPYVPPPPPRSSYQ